MTREEATGIIDKLPLCNECDSSNFPYSCVECGDAFLLAMKALKEPEIVRCKDCKYCVKEPNGELFCDILAVGYEPLGSKKVNEGWFCADGEKADDKR